MFIENDCRKKIAGSKLRKNALDIVEAGLLAVDTRCVVKRVVNRSGSKLMVGKRVYDLKKYHRVFVIGIGKASYSAGLELELILGSFLTGGIVIDVKGGSKRKIKSFIGTHPFPSLKNINVTQKIIELLRGTDSQDLIITIVSGGGSTLLCQPFKLKYYDAANITRALMKQGATIQETNAVRKHISTIHGGQLVALANNATILSLIFSDVPGDDISVIASGPTVLDTTTVSDARRILKKYNVLKACGMYSCDLIETPKDPNVFRRVQNVLVVSNAIAVKAMAIKARELGYKPIVHSTCLTGEAREVGALMAKLPRLGEAVIAGGETTVCVRGNGKGGRNQELALGALEYLQDGGFVLSLASDGIDNSSVAGAFVDEDVRSIAERMNLSAKKYLDNNDSYHFFKKVGTSIETGITGINISDLMLSLRKI